MINVNTKAGLDNNGEVTLITGANGFVGRTLCRAMLHHGWTVNGGVRRECLLPKGTKPVVVGELHGETDWGNALRGVQVVIHTAARASHANLRYLRWHMMSALRFFLSPVYRQLHHKE